MRTVEAAGRNRETVALELNRFDWGCLRRPHYIGKVTVDDRPTASPSGGERRAAYPADVVAVDCLQAVRTVRDRKKAIVDRKPWRRLT
jgi:hypothetical protein